MTLKIEKEHMKIEGIELGRNYKEIMKSRKRITKKVKLNKERIITVKNACKVKYGN